MDSSLTRIVSGGLVHAMIETNGWGLRDYLVHAADYAVLDITMRIKDMHERVIVTGVDHYAIAHSLSFPLRFRRELLIFHMALDRRRPVPVGTIIVEHFHGERLPRPFFPTALTTHGGSTADYPPFSPGKTTLDIYNDCPAMPLLKSTCIITEKFTLPARNTTTSDSAVVAARAGLLNIAAATEVFQDLFRGYSFSIRQQHWYASVIRHLVAGRAPPPLSDDDVRDLLPPATGEGKGADSNVTLADDTESSKGTRDSHALIFMSPEQLREAHARLKACYDEKLENIRQKIAAGGFHTQSRNMQMSSLRRECELLSERYEGSRKTCEQLDSFCELLKQSNEFWKAECDKMKELVEKYRKRDEADKTLLVREHLQVQASVVESQKEITKLPEMGTQPTSGLESTTTQRVETLEKEIERLRALLAQSEGECQD